MRGVPGIISVIIGSIILGLGILYYTKVFDNNIRGGYGLAHWCWHNLVSNRS